MKSRAMRHYTWSILLLMTAYVLILFGVNAYFDSSRPSGVLAYAAGLLPALPIIGVFIVIGRLLATLEDEYLRMLLVRQTLFATGFMLSVATAWGFLQDFDLLPQVEAYWAAVLWFGGLGVGGCANAIIESRAGRTA